MTSNIQRDSETIHDKLIGWAEANPGDAALMLSRTISASPACAVFEMIAWGKEIGIQGLPEIKRDRGRSE